MDLDYYINAYFCTLQKKLEERISNNFSTPNPMDIPMEVEIFNLWMEDNGLDLYDRFDREAIMGANDYRLRILLLKGYDMILKSCF